MKILRGLQALSDDPPRRPVCTIGFFDGFHRGHASLMNDLLRWSEELAGTSTVITFSTHPKQVVLGSAPAVLTPLERRLELIEAMGIDTVLVLPFDEQFSRISPEQFIREVLVGALATQHLLMGFDSAFGQGAKGTAQYLQQIPDLPLEVRLSPPLMMEGEAVSSSVVRSTLQEGDLTRAQRLLGRPFSLRGEVIVGDQRGASIGFPTANLDPGPVLVPPVGVYLGSVILGTPIPGTSIPGTSIPGTSIPGTSKSPGEVVASDNESNSWPAAINIGRRPTFGTPEAPEGTPFDPQLDRLEAHLDGFEGDLYGQIITVELHRRLRGERRFESLDALRRQIVRDVESLRDWWQVRGADGATEL
ncbi:MAG: bifunctional riboflavin kinase/FMN adenylyltransferase [Planctomycetes bacterium]|nr:bifunctional riboflavin kinase/FMN adenylyltransferase [Planctomycetota bacterium]MBT6452573.1 bifunctional riboflavin kinase/FMN adenylyltransferase [Planctomycetota bacterium]MBT6540244.1 bifunctional riboflavin kinase/FMN adenylyltransferase [Planctomycetota bacterium]MBT7102991.1 bifunctional riboflavin kinase/FMN adenylyltransferase [Planctomycetota bacterium]MBT7130560.1 bifunctional riboflavin kinase/FMN adenylyltransferase [Planctomycetota bacterium]